MATSRYDAPAATSAVQPKVGTSTTGSQNTNTTGTSQTQGTSNTSGSSRTEQNTSQSTQNMTGSSLAALELLIQQMLGGGTQEMALSRAQRQQEIQRNQSAASGYTRESAFADAQGLMAQTMRQTLEKLLPSITRGSEGAGTSQGSMRALLTQKAASEAAEAASAQGLGAAVNYGQVNAGFGSILERLTQPDNSATNALLQALQVAKGAVTNTTGKSVSQTDSDQTTNSSSNTNTSQQSNTNSGQTIVPIGGSAGSSSSLDQLAYFGPQQIGPSANAGTAGTTQDLLEQLGQLSGNSSGWSNGFTF